MMRAVVVISIAWAAFAYITFMAMGEALVALANMADNSESMKENLEAIRRKG